MREAITLEERGQQQASAYGATFGMPYMPVEMAESHAEMLLSFLPFGAKGLRAARSAEDVLVLGRGPLSRLENLARQQGGHVSTINSRVPKEIFKNNYRDIRRADKIIQYMDNIPTTLEEATRIQPNGLPFGGQYSRAEVYMIKQRSDLFMKTRQLYENTPTGL